MKAQLSWVRRALCAGACIALVACAHEHTQMATAAHGYNPTVTITSSTVKTPQLRVSREIVSACNITLDPVKEPAASRAPHFDFDKSNLQPADDAMLDKIADCLTKGPLAGRSIALIGRADPRGEIEYNFALGEHRADSVVKYLESRGVDTAHLQPTSRGKLDATGTDATTWAADRRVDLVLL